MSPQFYDPKYLAPAGTTGTVTSAAIQLEPDVEQVAIETVVEAVGATPTMTWKAQVSVDGANWFDASYVTDANDTVATAAIVQTAVGAAVIFLRGEAVDRGWRYVRLVVSANTNVTFRTELRQHDAD